MSGASSDGFLTRRAGAWLIAALVGSWPSALIMLLERRLRVVDSGAMGGFVIALVVTVLTTAALAWVVWPSIQKYSGLCAFYAILVGFPLCSVWSASGWAASTSMTAGDIAFSSVRILFFAAPVILIAGMFIGADLALTLWVTRVAHQRRGIAWSRFTVVAALAAHYATAATMVVGGRLWQ
jgi:hypothetical protein